MAGGALPGHVGLGVAAGALPIDFEVMGLTMDDLATRFASGLEQLAGLLGGHDTGPLAADAAIARCREHPVPLLDRGGEHHCSAARGAPRLRPDLRLTRHSGPLPRTG